MGQSFKKLSNYVTMINGGLVTGGGAQGPPVNNPKLFPNGIIF